MQKLKIYLETTMFNYYFDTDRDANADTVILFEECAAWIFKPYTSLYVISELEDAPSYKRDKMLALLNKYSIIVLAASEEADNLARRYIADGALPSGSLTDASHIAVASVHELDMIISLNFNTILNLKSLQSHSLLAQSCVSTSLSCTKILHACKLFKLRIVWLYVFPS